MKKIVFILAFVIIGLSSMAQKGKVDPINITIDSHANGCCDFPVPVKKAELMHTDLLKKQFKIEGSMCNGEYGYKLIYTPTQNLINTMKAYSQYMSAMFSPCLKEVNIGYIIYDLEGVPYGFPNNRKITPYGYHIFSNGVVSRQDIMFGQYFQNPTDVPAPSGVIPSGNNCLKFNRKYMLAYGLYPTSKCGADCSMASARISFRFNTPASTLKTTKPVAPILEILDEKGNVIERIKVSL